MLIRLLVLFITLVMVGCASHKPQGYVKLIDKSSTLPENAQLYVKVPEGIATFIGKAPDYRGKTQSSAMLYPAITPVDFFASVIAHAAVSESLRDSHKNSLQSVADKVIEPYRAYSDSLKNKNLVNQLKEIALSRGFTLNKYENSQHDEDLILDITPIYLLNKTEETLILRNQFLVYKKKYKSKKERKKRLLFQNQIEVFSGATIQGSAQEYWLNNDGENLKNEMNQLFSESLNLIAERISSKAKDTNVKYKNYRYNDGDSVVFERAIALSESCEKVIFKTLRGWLKSIPASRIVNQTECPKQPIDAVL